MNSVKIDHRHTHKSFVAIAGGIKASHLYSSSGTGVLLFEVEGFLSSFIFLETSISSLSVADSAGLGLGRTDSVLREKECRRAGVTGTGHCPGGLLIWCCHGKLRKA